MTIPLFEEYKQLAPGWSKILESNTIRTGNPNYSITEGSSCLVGEIYNRNNNYADHCKECYEFAMIAQHLIDEIPRGLKITTWDTPKYEFKDKLANCHNQYWCNSYSSMINRVKKLNMVMEIYDRNIDTYRDLFNAAANNYLQHIAKCEYYIENAGLTR